jgi:hypothetical protein
VAKKASWWGRVRNSPSRPLRRLLVGLRRKLLE